MYFMRYIFLVIVLIGEGSMHIYTHIHMYMCTYIYTYHNTPHTYLQALVLNFHSNTHSGLSSKVKLLKETRDAHSGINTEQRI